MRTYIALGLMVVIPTLMTLAIKLGGRPRERGDLDFFALARHSGLNMPLAALLSPLSFLLLPIVVLLFAGSAVGEEANWGSLRYLLIRPVSRSRLLTAKL